MVDRLVVSWATSEPDRVAARLAALGFSLIDGRSVDFPSGQIRIVSRGSGRGPDRLLDPRWEPAAADPAARAGHTNGVTDLVALGWATVDADRASAGPLIDSAGTFAPLPDDRQLGARVQGALVRRPAILLLEPGTEGRLAATLARVGEGPAAIYLTAGDGGAAGPVAGLDAGRVAASGAGRGRAVRPGPLGPAALLPGGAVWGPHLLVVAQPPTAPD
jgi:hypothetical protein